MDNHMELSRNEQIKKQLDHYESVTNARRDRKLERAQMKELLRPDENEFKLRTPSGGTCVKTKFVVRGNYKTIMPDFRNMPPLPKYRVLFNKKTLTFATKEQFYLWVYRRCQTLMAVDPYFANIFHNAVKHIENKDKALKVSKKVDKEKVSKEVSNKEKSSKVADKPAKEKVSKTTDKKVTKEASSDV